MKSEAAQTAGGMAAAAFFAGGEIWLALAAAVAGATAALVLEKEDRPADFWKALLAIAAVSALALALAIGIAAMLKDAAPILGMLDVSAIPRPVWAFIFGIFGKPIYRRLRRVPEEMRLPGGNG